MNNKDLLYKKLNALRLEVHGSIVDNIKLTVDAIFQEQLLLQTPFKAQGGGIKSKRMKTIRHMSTNIEGMLRNMKGKKINFLDDDNGRQMTDKEARVAIAELQAKGHKLIPSGDCDGFDPLGGGCPGHPVIED